MKKFSAVIDIAHLVSAVLLVVVLGSLMYTMTDISTWNTTTKNGSGVLTTMGSLLPLLVVITVAVSFLSFAQPDG
jgi:hypothetical protein